MSRTARVKICTALALLPALPARSEPGWKPSWQLGAQLRDSGGFHSVRVGASASWCRVQIALWLDPWYPIDRRSSTDLLVRTNSKIEFVAGIRNQAVAISGGVRWFESVLVGVNAPIAVAFERVQIRAGVQFARDIVTHGAGLGANWVTLREGFASTEPYAFEMVAEVRVRL